MSAEFLDRQQLQEMLGVTRAELTELHCGGLLPLAVKVGSRFLYSRRAIERWLTENCPVSDEHLFASWFQNEVSE